MEISHEWRTNHVGLDGLWKNKIWFPFVLFYRRTRSEANGWWMKSSVGRAKPRSTKNGGAKSRQFVSIRIGRVRRRQTIGIGWCDPIRCVWARGKEGRKKGSSAGSKAVRTNLYQVRGSLFLLHADSSSSAEVRAVMNYSWRTIKISNKNLKNKGKSPPSGRSRVEGDWCTRSEHARVN